MKKIIFKIKFVNDKKSKYVFEDKDNNMFYFLDDKTNATEYLSIEAVDVKERLNEFLKDNKLYCKIEKEEIK